MVCTSVGPGELCIRILIPKHSSVALTAGSSTWRAQAAEALAASRVEIAQRGLAVTVTRNYYAFVTSQRKYATAQQSAQQAQRFLEITQQQERVGQVARSDVVKAQIQYEQQRQALQEA